MTGPAPGHANWALLQPPVMRHALSMLLATWWLKVPSGATLHPEPLLSAGWFNLLGQIALTSVIAYTMANQVWCCHHGLGCMI